MQIFYFYFLAIFFNISKHFLYFKDFPISDDLSLEHDSLEFCYNKNKTNWDGVAGVYKLTNKINPNRFYIGSSVNLGRRFLEYINIINGVRKSNSSTELELSKSKIHEWKLEILYTGPPQLSLIHEQLFIIEHKPTMNKYYSVVPRVNIRWKNIDLAINLLEKLLKRFDKNSFGYKRFIKFLTVFKYVKESHIIDDDLEGNYLNTCIYVYNINNPNLRPVI